MLRRPKHHVVDEPSAPLRVLVVNEDEAASEVLCRVLARAEYVVDRATNQRDSLYRLSSAPADCVVLDLATGGIGTNPKLLDALRSNGDTQIANVRVVLIAKQTTNRLFSWQAGVDAFLVRPFHADDLLREVAEALDRPDEERAQHRRHQLHEAEGEGRTMEGRPWDSQRF